MSELASKEKINSWIDSLNEDQKRQAITRMLEYCHESEWIVFHDDDYYLAPYYDSCGEALVDGQQAHREDEVQ